MPNENLNDYRIFYTVAKEKNISRAAHSLFISQPAVSKVIRRLENRLGATLFFRTSRGVSLTAEGQVLFESVKAAMQSLSSGEYQILKMKSLDLGHIRIGVSTTLCKHLLLPYLKDFIRMHPHVRISILCQSTNHTVKLLEEGAIDIGLIGRPLSDKNIAFLPLTEIEDIFVGSPSCLDNLGIPMYDADINQDSKPACPDSTLFDTATILLLDKENMTRQYIDDYLSSRHIQPTHLLEVTTMDLLIEFAKIGLGVACVIKNFAKEELKSGTLIEVPLSIPIPHREVGFAYSLRRALSCAAEEFIKAVES